MEKYSPDDIINKYRHLKQLEKKYLANDLNKLAIYREIIETLEMLKSELAEFSDEIDGDYSRWKYHAIANRKHIEVMDNENLLKILCTAANIIEPKYDIKTLKVTELVSPEDASYSLLKFGTVSILSDKETLKRFKEKNSLYYYSQLINEFNKLTRAKESFIVSSNLVNEYDGEYIKERIASFDTKDIIISVNPGDPLDECINKFAMYATKYGSDFNEKKINAVANLINYQPIKTRKLTNNKYIEYFKKDEE